MVKDRERQVKVRTDSFTSDGRVKMKLIKVYSCRMTVTKPEFKQIALTTHDAKFFQELGDGTL